MWRIVSFCTVSRSLDQVFVRFQCTSRIDKIVRHRVSVRKCNGRGDLMPVETVKMDESCEKLSGYRLVRPFITAIRHARSVNIVIVIQQIGNQSPYAIYILIC